MKTSVKFNKEIPSKTVHLKDLLRRVELSEGRKLNTQWKGGPRVIESIYEGLYSEVQKKTYTDQQFRYLGPFYTVLPNFEIFSVLFLPKVYRFYTNIIWVSSFMFSIISDFQVILQTNTLDRGLKSRYGFFSFILILYYYKNFRPFLYFTNPWLDYVDLVSWYKEFPLSLCHLYY